MQRALCFCLICLMALMVAPSVIADSANPISKVIELLSALEAKIMKDGEAEAKAYKDFFEWCDDAAKEKGFALKTETAKKLKLEATINKAKSEIEDAEEMISELSATISEDEADLKAATAIRAKEHKSFTAEEAELMAATDMSGRAITIIEREMKGSSLIQTKLNFQNLNGWVQALKTLLDATSISTADKKDLVAFVQSQQGEDDDAESGAPDPAAYESKSGGIVDVLTDMKEKADAQLAELRKVEKTDAHNFDLLKISIDDALAANNKELDETRQQRLKLKSSWLQKMENSISPTRPWLRQLQVRTLSTRTVWRRLLITRSPCKAVKRSLQLSQRRRRLSSR